MKMIIINFYFKVKTKGKYNYDEVDIVEGKGEMLSIISSEMLKWRMKNEE